MQIVGQTVNKATIAHDRDSWILKVSAQLVLTSIFCPGISNDQDGTLWLHQLRRLNVGTNRVDIIVEMTQVSLTLNDTTPAIGAKIVPRPVSKLPIKALQFYHVPKEA